MSRRISRKTDDRTLVIVKYDCDNADCGDSINVSMTKKASRQSAKHDMDALPCLSCSTGMLRKVK